MYNFNMQIVTILDIKEIETKVSQELVPNIECNIITHENPEDFLSLCQIVPDVDALICDDTHVSTLVKICKQNNLPLDFIYIGEKEFDFPELNFHRVSKNQSLLDYVKTNLNHTCIPISADSQHRSIPIRYLSSVRQAPANFYYKIQKENFSHYVKIIKKGDEVSPFFIQEKYEKGLLELWVEKDDKPRVINLFNEIFLKILDKNNVSSAYLDRDKIHKDIFDLLTSIGLSDKSVELATTAINEFQANLGKGLIQSLNKMLKVTGPFAYKKTYLTCIIISSFTKQISWATESHIQALLLCSYFNDVFLTSTDMHLITTAVELNNAASLTPKEISTIEKHAEMASEWIEKQPGVPAEVVRLIKQHHGAVNGHGFQVEFDKRITKLSELFIVCEEFADQILQNTGNKLNIAGIISALKQKYSSKTIHVFADALLMTIKKEISKS